MGWEVSVFMQKGRPIYFTTLSALGKRRNCSRSRRISHNLSPRLTANILDRVSVGNWSENGGVEKGKRQKSDADFFESARATSEKFAPVIMRRPPGLWIRHSGLGSLFKFTVGWPITGTGCWIQAWGAI